MISLHLFYLILFVFDIKCKTSFTKNNINQVLKSLKSFTIRDIKHNIFLANQILSLKVCNQPNFNPNHQLTRRLQNTRQKQNKDPYKNQKKVRLKRKSKKKGTRSNEGILEITVQTPFLKAEEEEQKNLLIIGLKVINK